MKTRIYTAALCLLLLAGCGAGPETGEKFEGEVNTYEGVTMTAVEDTALPGTVTVEILNTTNKEIDSGNEADFALQKEVDGEWHWLETKQKEYANTAEALIYPKDETVEQVLTWARVYGSLAEGHYRVVKAFFEYRGPGDNTDFLLAAEFTID